MIDLKELEIRVDDALSKESPKSLKQFLNNQRNGSIKELELEFEGKGEVKGYHFKQIKKSDKAYIYEVTNLEFQTTHYEVFRRRENRLYGNVTYPKTNVFGKYAWTLLTLDKAIEFFNEF